MLVNYEDYTEMHGQQNIKIRAFVGLVPRKVLIL